MLQAGIDDKPNLRLGVEGTFYRRRVGCPWRDLPKQFGNGSFIYKKFNDGLITGKWLMIFKVLVPVPDLEWILIDGSYIQAHPPSAGAFGKHCAAIGISCEGYTSQIQLAVDSFGLPDFFKITGGPVHNASQAPALIESLSGPTVLK